MLATTAGWWVSLGWVFRDKVERVLGVNNTQVISVEIVEAARDSLVIGQA
jgi:hypothetical protein